MTPYEELSLKMLRQIMLGLGSLIEIQTSTHNASVRKDVRDDVEKWSLATTVLAGIVDRSIQTAHDRKSTHS
jgi:hypothetical protein